MGAMAYANSFLRLSLTSLFAGAAFSALYALSAAIISEQENQTRWFGLKLSMEGFSGALLFVVLPGTLIASYGFDGILLGMAIVVLALCPLWFWLPHSVPDRIETLTPDSSIPPSSSLAVWLALAGTLVFFAGQTTIWAFLERLGATAGHESESITNILSVTLLFAVAGSMAAAALGSGFGNRLPFCLCCLIFFAAAFGLNHSESFDAFAFGACIATLSVAAGLVFGISEIAGQDPNGRFIVLSVPAVGIGAMIGPGLAGYLADAYGFSAVLWFGVATVALGGLLFIAISLSAQLRSNVRQGQIN